MSISDTIETLKPYAGGAVIGAIGIAVVGFSLDWVVMTGTMEQKVRETRVSALAEVCETNALAHWKQQGKEASALEGWDNDARTKLADQFAPATVEGADLREDIVDKCDDLLEPV